MPAAPFGSDCSARRRSAGLLPLHWTPERRWPRRQSAEAPIGVRQRLKLWSQAPEPRTLLPAWQRTVSVRSFWFVSPLVRALFPPFVSRSGIRHFFQQLEAVICVPLRDQSCSSEGLLACTVQGWVTVHWAIYKMTLNQLVSAPTLNQEGLRPWPYGM